MMSLVSTAVMPAEKKPTTSNSSCEDDDVDVQYIQLPSISVDVSHQNVDVEAADDTPPETVVDDLVVIMARIKLQQSNDDNLQLPKVNSNDAADVAGWNELAAPQNGCLQTGSEAPSGGKCERTDQLNAMSSVCDSDDLDVGNQLNTTDNDEGRRNNAVKTGTEKENLTEDSDHRFVVDLGVVKLENDDDDDHGDLEETGQQMMGEDCQHTVGNCTAHGPLNGHNTRPEDGNQPSKYMKCSPNVADSASMPPTTGVMGTHFIDVSQPWLTDLEYLQTQIRHSPNAAEGFRPIVNYHPGWPQYLQRIPGPPAWSDCRLPNTPSHRSLCVSNPCMPQACNSLAGMTVESPTVPGAVSRPTVAPLSTALESPINLESEILQELSAEDVLQWEETMPDNSFFGTSADNVSNTYLDHTLTSARMTSLNTIQRQHSCNILPSFVITENRVNSLPSQDQVVAFSPSLPVSYRVPPQSSPTSSDRSQGRSSVSSYDQPPSATAAGSFGSYSNIAELTVVNPERSSSVSGGSPALTTDGSEGTFSFSSTSIDRLGLGDEPTTQPDLCDDTHSLGIVSDCASSRPAKGYSMHPPAGSMQWKYMKPSPKPGHMVASSKPVSSNVVPPFVWVNPLSPQEQVVAVSAASSSSLHLSPSLYGENEEQRNVEERASQLSQSDLLLQNDDGDSVLHTALIFKETFYAEALIRRYDHLGLLQRVIGMRNHMQQTPLCVAVITNQPILVERLLQLGSDVNAQIVTDRGQQIPTKREQPLHFAASKGHPWLNTLRALLRSPHIDINAYNSEGRSALHCAVESHGRATTTVPIDATHTIRLLVDSGANLNKPDGQSDKSPLHYAIEKRDVELVRLLLELAGTPAAVAAASKASDGRCMSLEAAMLNARTGTGNAALHLAVSVRHMIPADKRRLVQLLLSRGADPSTKNSEGQLPREMMQPDREIEALLRGRSRHSR